MSKNSVNNGINYESTGAGFLPSTVAPAETAMKDSSVMFWVQTFWGEFRVFVHSSVGIVS